MFKSKLQTEKCVEKAIPEKERGTKLDQTMHGPICSIGVLASKPQNIQGIEANSPDGTSAGSSFVFVQEEDIVQELDEEIDEVATVATVASICAMTTQSTSDYLGKYLPTYLYVE